MEGPCHEIRVHTRPLEAAVISKPRRPWGFHPFWSSVMKPSRPDSEGGRGRWGRVGTDCFLASVSQDYLHQLCARVKGEGGLL